MRIVPVRRGSRERYGAIVDVLDRMIDEAAAALQAATGGAALCRITASGSPGWSAKRAEGRWAALQALASALRQDDSDPARAVASLRERWAADLARWSTQPDSSWVPYCEGGLEGLADVEAAVSTEPPDEDG